MKTKNNLNFLKNCFSSKAFTLVEIMVVVAVFAIVTTIGVANYNKGKDQRELEASAQYLASVLREARTMAQTGQIFDLDDDGVEDSRPENGLGIYVSDSKNYVLFANQGGEDDLIYDESTGDKILQTYDLPEHTIFEEGEILGSRVGDVFIFTPDGGMYFDSGVIKLKLDYDDAFFRCIRINRETGRIEVGDCGCSAGDCAAGVLRCNEDGDGTISVDYACNEVSGECEIDSSIDVDSCASAIPECNLAGELCYNLGECIYNSIGTAVCSPEVCELDPSCSESCGDGTIDSDEECDDGNDVNGDGCDADCNWETQSTDCIEPTLTHWIWNGGDSYLQVCESSDGVTCISWNPALISTEYNEVLGQCHFVCDSGYYWDGDSCELITYCGDEETQSPNSESTGGPDDDGYEDCDGGISGGVNSDCVMDWGVDGDETDNHVCASASCGDGYIWNTDCGSECEECDNGSANSPTGFCNTDCTINSLKVFVTAGNYTGNLGGWEGANAICANEASDASDDSFYRAWISTDAHSPANNWEHLEMRYQLIDEIVVAEGWSDLTDGSIEHRINKDLTSSTYSAEDVWTNTSEEGFADTTVYDCNRWQSLSSGGITYVGVHGIISEGDWTVGGRDGCTSLSYGYKKIYCFQDFSGESVYPRINDFSIDGVSGSSTEICAGSSIDLTWDVEDLGDYSADGRTIHRSGLNRVELWRGVGSGPITWDSTALWSASPVRSGDDSYSFSTTIPGTYEFGLHTADNDGSCLTESAKECGTDDAVFGRVDVGTLAISVVSPYTTASCSGCGTLTNACGSVICPCDEEAPVVDDFRLSHTDCTGAEIHMQASFYDEGEIGSIVESVDRVEVWQYFDGRPSGSDTWEEVVEFDPGDDDFACRYNSILGITECNFEWTGYLPSDEGSDGYYNYGIHVIDNFGNCITESGEHCGGVLSDSYDIRDDFSISNFNVASPHVCEVDECGIYAIGGCTTTCNCSNTLDTCSEATSGTCVANPLTCDYYSVVCGSGYDDGYGGTLDCGTCDEHYECVSGSCEYVSYCGDGVVDSGEECDDANDDSTDGCHECMFASLCGDGIIRTDISDTDHEFYEQCDDGDGDNFDECLNTCRNARCGDGFLRTDLSSGETGYEQCDGDDSVCDDGSGLEFVCDYLCECHTPGCRLNIMEVASGSIGMAGFEAYNDGSQILDYYWSGSTTGYDFGTLTINPGEGMTPEVRVIPNEYTSFLGTQLSYNRPFPLSAYSESSPNFTDWIDHGSYYSRTFDTCPADIEDDNNMNLSFSFNASHQINIDFSEDHGRAYLTGILASYIYDSTCSAVQDCTHYEVRRRTSPTLNIVPDEGYCVVAIEDGGGSVLQSYDADFECGSVSFPVGLVLNNKNYNIVFAPELETTSVCLELVSNPEVGEASIHQAGVFGSMTLPTFGYDTVDLSSYENYHWQGYLGSLYCQDVLVGGSLTLTPAGSSSSDYSDHVEFEGWGSSICSVGGDNCSINIGSSTAFTFYPEFSRWIKLTLQKYTTDMIGFVSATATYYRDTFLLSGTLTLPNSVSSVSALIPTYSNVIVEAETSGMYSVDFMQVFYYPYASAFLVGRDETLEVFPDYVPYSEDGANQDMLIKIKTGL